MFEIPLFPLNTVLFPGTPIHLHIFEERYKQMINLCLQEQRLFGVVLIRNGMEALGPLAEPFHIGCTAEIVHFQRLEDGQMNLVAVGQERVRILSFNHQNQPYLVGKVRAYPLTNPDPSGVVAQAALLRRQLEQLVELLSRAGGSQLDLNQLPQDGISLAFLAAAVLQISPLQKQELLSIERVDKLLQRLQLLYRREITLMHTVMADVKSLQAGGFSRN
jgi:Lon protease-like protein